MTHVANQKNMLMFRQLFKICIVQDIQPKDILGSLDVHPFE